MKKSKKAQWWITDGQGEHLANIPKQMSNHPHISGRKQIEDHIHYNGELVAQIMRDAVEDITDEFEVCILRQPKEEELVRILRYAISKMKEKVHGEG